MAAQRPPTAAAHQQQQRQQTCTAPQPHSQAAGQPATPQHPLLHLQGASGRAVHVLQPTAPVTAAVAAPRHTAAGSTAACTAISSCAGLHCCFSSQPPGSSRPNRAASSTTHPFFCAPPTPPRPHPQHPGHWHWHQCSAHRPCPCCCCCRRCRLARRTAVSAAGLQHHQRGQPLVDHLLQPVTVQVPAVGEQQATQAGHRRARACQVPRREEAAGMEGAADGDVRDAALVLPQRGVLIIVVVRVCGATKSKEAGEYTCSCSKQRL
ncbi:hypothetical protein COO60DRAFT_265350 [Scenedesmus sp. NREL 46B-D3]|nr:hypothetical protein COO60DRAFT_265350 [Scenedesmus sp. NREL 46B-D3]